MKLAVVGSRDCTRVELMRQVLDNVNKERKITLIISGGAPGADRLAVDYAKENDIPWVEYKADWKDLSQPDAIIKQGKYGMYDAFAGIRRNKLIIDDADRVIAFWDEKSPGTLNSIKRAKKQEKRVTIVKYKLIPDE